MVLLKLGLVPKKVLLFINSINEGYRLRLFLEAFGIKSAVLNAELPLNSRHHILQVCHDMCRYAVTCCSYAVPAMPVACLSLHSHQVSLKQEQCATVAQSTG